MKCLRSSLFKPLNTGRLRPVWASLALLSALLIGLLQPSPIRAQARRTLNVDNAGTLVEQLTEDEANRITHLTLTGKLNAIDFRHLRDEFTSLQELDLSEATVKAYTGKNGTCQGDLTLYPAGIPAYAFCRRVNDSTLEGKPTLRRIVLPAKTKYIGEAAFAACEQLRICQINRATPPELYRDAMSTHHTAVFVPQGSLDAYRLKNRWAGFAFLEGEPVSATVQVGRLGSLADALTAQGLQPGQIHFLTVEGKLDEADFLLIRDYMPLLVEVDLTRTTATTIPEFTFTQKKYLLRIHLPAGLQTIGQRAFSGCVRLSGTLTLPPTVTALERGAFMNCDHLERVLVTGHALTAVGESLFAGGGGTLVYGE